MLMLIFIVIIALVLRSFWVHGCDAPDPKPTVFYHHTEETTRKPYPLKGDADHADKKG